MKTVLITNLSQPDARSIQAGYCESFLCQLRGLMFRKSIAEGQGLLLVQKKDEKMNAGIHMMFMNFNICAVWINSANEVVDVRYAKRWALAYVPRAPARYVLELHTVHIRDFNIGDKVRIDA